MQRIDIINLVYLLSAVLFIYGIKGLTHPRTAVRGNLLGAAGMALAAIATMVGMDLTFEFIAIGLVVGTVIGALMAKRVEMTAMPELVAVFNGFGGLSSVLVAAAEVHRSGVSDPGAVVAISVATLVGSVTFLGSLIAYAKLAEKFISTNATTFPGQQAVNAALLAGAVGCAVWFGVSDGSPLAFWTLTGIGLVLGVLSVIRIGGGDMPVVISLLNSYSGVAAAAAGFVLLNNVLIVAGSLVGASGLILTNIMCKAMNRSLANVLFGTFEPASGGPSQDEVYAGKVKATSAEEVAMILEGIRRVMVVPGYGLALAQAQHAVRDLAKLLESRDIEVLYAIHPVAGRMPGHMNVLLAEADVPYDRLLEMDAANAMIEQTDVAIVLGANDVVNPSAREDPTSPIAGMPIIDVDKAKTVIVIKRSLSPGFAKIPNPLFAATNALMLFD
ncbi:MAG: NAD(P)(+) transhydrogenase (Re/Si-specific) subunit beta, partial [Myxococcales bacterium]|nr:NAD(P)(+) transhydrogenase (Re/Si-specific) subunit beta [Myxococcales bacterium]